MVFLELAKKAATCGWLHRKSATESNSAAVDGCGLNILTGKSKKSTTLGLRFLIFKLKESSLVFRKFKGVKHLGSQCMKQREGYFTITLLLPPFLHNVAPLEGLC